MPVPTVPPEFDQLSTPEKIEYVQKLWERIANSSEAAELTDAQRAELDRRLDAHQKNPTDGSPWSEVNKRIRGDE
jgi:putative addiction module component (TIGR02574 family)